MTSGSLAGWWKPAVLCCALAVVAGGTAQAQGSGPIVVFAAASLKTALDLVVVDWRRESGRQAVVSYAASSALARQIENDAPAQLFISADLDWMDYVAGKGLIKPASRSNLLGNGIVLAARKESTVMISSGGDLAKDLSAALGNGRLAIADVRAVPAGKYGRAALEQLGAWRAVADRLAQTENVRAALLLVSRGETPLGLVYRTDVAADPAVRVVAELPASSHPPIVYPIALIKKAGTEAEQLLAFIKSPKAAAYFAAQGFSVLE